MIHNSFFFTHAMFLRTVPRLLTAASAPFAEALRQRLSDRALPPMEIRQLWTYQSTAHRLVEEFNVGPMSQRYARVAEMLRFLSDHNVLVHSLLRHGPPGPQPPPTEGNVILAGGEKRRPPTARRRSDSAALTVRVSPEFRRLALVGESLYRSETTLRVARLFPLCSADLLVQMQQVLCEPGNLALLFDGLSAHTLGTPPSSDSCSAVVSGVAATQSWFGSLKGADDAKALFVYSTIAELNWFVVKTKATDRTHNNALFPPSDALILHVLAAHTVECLLSFLLVDQLLAVAQSLRQGGQWQNHTLSLPQQLKRDSRTHATRGIRSRRLDVNIVPSTRIQNEARLVDASQLAVLAKPANGPVGSKVVCPTNVTLDYASWLGRTAMPRQSDALVYGSCWTGTDGRRLDAIAAAPSPPQERRSPP